MIQESKIQEYFQNIDENGDEPSQQVAPQQPLLVNSSVAVTQSAMLNNSSFLKQMPPMPPASSSQMLSSPAEYFIADVTLVVSRVKFLHELAYAQYRSDDQCRKKIVMTTSNRSPQPIVKSRYNEGLSDGRIRRFLHL